jgi:cytochrome c-type protein NapC
MNEPVKTKSRLRRFFGWLRSPSKLSLLVLLSLGFVGGILFWGGFHTGLEMTNTREFCIGCHEMRDNVYMEYTDTIHFKNRTGVQASCSDCHVPKAWGPKMLRKLKASQEVWGHLTGYIDTKEKFESHRMEMATREWARFKATDSLACRNCHSWEAMAVAKQRPAAQTKHAEAQKNGGTCIDCHKGIAHLLPAEYVDPANEE